MNSQGFVTFVSSMYLLVFALIIGNVIMTLSLKGYEPFLAKQIQQETSSNINHLKCIEKQENSCHKVKFKASDSKLIKLLEEYSDMEITDKELKKILEKFSELKGKQEYEIIYDKSYATIVKDGEIEYRFEIRT